MKHTEIIRKMSLEDKIALCSGENFWQTKGMEKYGIPSLFMCDGPHGLRKQDREDGADMLGVNESRKATCFPTAVTTASTWDPALIEEIGMAIGEEAASQDVGLVLGPGANIKRNPLCGRNFEYYSEDPYLTGKMAAAFIRGVQHNGVASSLKHFAFNNQEYSRFNSDSMMDERTMREIYLRGFEIAVKEGKPKTLMCAYNKINGTHCSDSELLLNDILRKEWGSEALVVTDWGAMNDRIKGFRAGCDLNMPGGSEYMEKDVLAAVKDGSLSERAIDVCVDRILSLVFNAVKVEKKQSIFDEEDHHKLSKKAAKQGAVLLKNENILPLKAGQSIAVIGYMAKKPRYQGAGSSHINPTKVSNALEFMHDVRYAEGCTEKGETTDEMLLDAKIKAKKSDVAVIFAGLPDRYESEGFDRENLSMPNGHLKMIEAVASSNPNTVVVLQCGCVVECPWADSVKGILFMGLTGQAGGEAVTDLLYGKTNPSGKLTESWPYRYADCPSADYYKDLKDAQYREGIYIGYRYYDKSGTAVRWPFGFGLSYTKFTYSNIKVTKTTVTATITNSGLCAGAEVSQLYVAAPQIGIHKPQKELKGFQKIFLEPGESKELIFVLNDRSFAIWDGEWKIQKGTYQILVGGNSIDLPLQSEIDIEGVDIIAPAWQKESWYESLHGTVTKQTWESMYGSRYQDQKLKKGQFTMDNSVIEMKDFSFIMKIMHRAVEKTVAKGFGGKIDYENPEFRMLMSSSAGSPLRSMQISGGMKGGVFKGLLEMANGHYLRGIIKMIKG